MSSQDVAQLYAGIKRGINVPEEHRQAYFIRLRKEINSGQYCAVPSFNHRVCLELSWMEELALHFSSPIEEAAKIFHERPGCKKHHCKLPLCMEVLFGLVYADVFLQNPNGDEWATDQKKKIRDNAQLHCNRSLDSMNLKPFHSLIKPE